jgi:hypothetical protein
MLGFVNATYHHLLAQPTAACSDREPRVSVEAENVIPKARKQIAEGSLGTRKERKPSPQPQVAS